MGHSIDHYPEFHILRRSKNLILVLDHDNLTRNIHLYRRPRSLRQVSGIKYLNQMNTYHLPYGHSEIT